MPIDGGTQTAGAWDQGGDDTANDGYDTIPLLGNAKNVMTVGAVDDAVANGERSLEPAAMMQFSGWELMNTKTAAALIELHHDDKSLNVLTVDSISEGGTKRFSFTTDGLTPLRATICWTDPAGESTYELDDRSQRLVHNLDLRITGPGEIVYRPYVLDPENPDGAAELGDNNVDNVEQVVVSETAQAGTFEITVVVDGLLARGSQEFALIVSGMTGSAGSAPEVALNQRIQVPTDGSGFSTISGEVTDGNGEICELEVEYTTDGSSWYHAEVVDASCAAGPLPLNNGNTTQVTELSAPGDTRFNLTWDSRNSENPVEISRFTRIRVRAWDGLQWSGWSVSGHFEIDNVAPETENAEFVDATRAFGRYALESSVQIS